MMVFKRFKKINLTERLVLNFMLIGLGSTIVVGLLSFFMIRNALFKGIFEQLTDIRLVKKNQIESFFDDRTRDIEMLEKTYEVENFQEIFSNTNPSKFIYDEFKRKSYVYQFLFSSGYYNGIVFSDYRVVIDLSIGLEKDSLALIQYKLSDNPFLLERINCSENSGGVFFVDFSVENQDVFLYMVSPIKNNKRNDIGFIALKVSHRVIDNMTLKASRPGGFGESGETYIVGDDGLMRSSSRFITNAVMNTKVNTIGVEEAFSKGEGVKIIDDYRGIKVLSSYSRLNISGLNWVLLTEIDFQEVLLPIVKVRNHILIIGSFIGLLVFILAWTLASKITKPLIRLKEAAQKISYGEFEDVIEASGEDELNDLIVSFNQMSQEIRNKQQQLQEEKKQRITAMIDGQEAERKRLSLDIHDSFIQSLVALKFRVEKLINSQEQDKKIQDITENLVKNISEIISEAKLMSVDLMPPVFYEHGILIGLTQLCERMRLNHSKQIYFEHRGEFKNLPTRLAEYLYRIAQEGLSNAAKHSDSEVIYLHLNELANHYLMLIEDKGKGFDLNSSSLHKGNGLTNMKERVFLLNGVIEFQSVIGDGTVIHIRIPKI